MEGNLRVGQEFEGTGIAFLPPNFRRFDFAINDKNGAVPGRIGDRPALRMSAPEAGLLIVTHVTTDTKIVWEDWADFAGFVEHKDAEWVLEEHVARGLDEVDASEAYSRYAKSLIAIGLPEGNDRVMGLETEIVALENPYIGNTDDGLDVQVLYQGAPRANEQIEVFEKASGTPVNVFTLQTDANGKATIPVKPAHRYMLDSVVVREPSAELAERMGRGMGKPLGEPDVRRADALGLCLGVDPATTGPSQFVRQGNDGNFAQDDDSHGA